MNSSAAYSRIEIPTVIRRALKVSEPALGRTEWALSLIAQFVARVMAGELVWR